MSTSLTRKFINLLLQAYLLPVRINKSLCRYIKEVVLLDKEEHITKSIRFLQQEGLLSPQPIVLDIGAAFGDATDIFIRSLPSCQVFAFEPNPYLVAGLKKRFSQQQVILFHTALGRQEEVVSFHLSSNTLSSSYKTVIDNEQFTIRESTTVKSDTLDHIFGDNKAVDSIDIIKLDVQGAELDVLFAGQQTLAKTKLLIIEQSIRSPYMGGAKYHEVDEYMRNCGFELVDIVTTFRKKGLVLNEFDSIYINKNLRVNLS